MNLKIKNPKNIEKNFIDRDKLYNLIESTKYSKEKVDEVLNKSLQLKGLTLEEAAILLSVNDDESLKKILFTAQKVKNLIYGKRLVLFAPLYIGNVCSNNCVYCAFRKDNKSLARVVLNMEQIENEVVSLLKEGHKRILMLSGESEETPIDYFLEAIRTAYRARYNNNNIRRINVEIAPLTVENFKKLKEEKIGTYACFQETYDPVLYKKYHPSTGPKANYEYRLTVMDRAMLGGIDDVGIGALFGLADYRFEVLALLEHARHLEETFGCGPHTVSVPRIEPAENAPLSTHIPYQVSDFDFKKLVAIIRLSLPWTGIILSTRETEELRNELFNYGVSQISAGSRTNPGAYSKESPNSGSQFSLGDHRTLDEVINKLIDMEYIPSFCTGCYRKGRVGMDFMDLAKPGLIKEFCMPNAVFTFMEYLIDFAKPETKEKGLKLVDKLLNEVEKKELKERMIKTLDLIKAGKRDEYF